MGKDAALLPAGVVSGQKVIFMFESITSQRVQASNFDRLPIPFRAVATDIVTGGMVVIGDGELSMAMRSSMSVPAVFDPVPRGDALLVDGGLVRNLPVDVVRDMGAQVVIAVDVGTKLAGAKEIDNMLSIVNQMSSLLTVFNTDEQIKTLKGKDVLIVPEIGDRISSADFGKLEQAIPIGYAAASAVEDQLRLLSLPESEYLAWRKQTNECVSGPPQVHFVQLDNQSRFSDEVISQLITIKPGDTLDLAQLNHDIRQIYGLGFIRQALYNIVEDDGHQGVRITVQQDKRGEKFIETGMDLSASGRGTAINIRAGYLNTALDDRGSEFRFMVQLGEEAGIFADYYKPLDDALKYNFQPSVSFYSRPLLVYDSQGNALAKTEIDEYGGALTFGREFGRHAGLFAGVTRYRGELDVTIGDPELEPFAFEGAEWFVELQLDRLDDRYLPTHGWLSQLKYTRSAQGLGADESFEQLEFSFFGSYTRGLHNFVWGTQYNTTLDDIVPLYAVYTAGGFFNMSGFEPNSLLGPHYGQILAGYRYQVGHSGFLPAYAGMTVEYGNAVAKRSDIFSEGILNGSLYFGYDSPVGPIYLGVGLSEERRAIYFMRLGTIFGPRSIGRR